MSDLVEASGTSAREPSQEQASGTSAREPNQEQASGTSAREPDVQSPATTHAGVRTLVFTERRLTAEAVERVERSLRAERDVSPVLLHCKALSEVTAAGLAALLELGRSAYGLREIALSELSRPLLLAAIQCGLAERFTIYATQEAGARHLGPRPTDPCAP